MFGITAKQHTNKDVVSWQKAWIGLKYWYQSGIGAAVKLEEDEQLEQLLPDIFGYFLLQIGCPESMAVQYDDWLKSSRISCKIKLDLGISAPGDNPNYQNIKGNFETLPIKTDCLDAIILPHSLEFSNSPHQLLREVDRILIPEGHVVILGFNPYSSWRLFEWFFGWRKQTNVPFNQDVKGQLISAARVIDWLNLLGFDVIKRQGYFYRPPFQHKAIMEKMTMLDWLGQHWWPRLGAGYVLVAKKRVVTFTPIKPPWRAKKSVMPAGIEATNRSRM